MREFDSGTDSRPSEVVKRRHLLRLFQERGHSILVESGTYMGGTVDFFLPHAAEIVSVELDDRLYAAARERFAGHAHVRIVHGDSRDAIPAEVARAQSAPLVWLDGHWSGTGTALGDEPEPALTILQRLAQAPLLAGTTIVVDDVRLLGREGAPPLEDVVAAAAGLSSSASLSIGFDSLVARI